MSALDLFYRSLSYLRSRLVTAGLLACVASALALGCNSSSGPREIECGGTAQFRCPPGYYCDLGPTCGGIDKLGRCRYQPTDCPNVDEVVCGCNGKNFSNACYANSTGETVAYEGSCVEKR